MMRKILGKWALRLAATGFLLASLLIVLVLHPSLTYAHRTAYQQYHILHDQPMAPSLFPRLDSVSQIIKTSELYRPDQLLTVCLDDPSKYPALLEKLRGPAFGWGFYNIVVLRGQIDYDAGVVARNGYRWGLTRLMAHEAVHCLQLNHFGLWRSNPIAGWPRWKWEGYAEYIARLQNTNLVANVDRLIAANTSAPDAWDIDMPDGTMISRAYYEYALLTQFCLEEKRMHYEQLLHDSTSREAVEQEMLHWYAQHTVTTVD